MYVCMCNKYVHFIVLRRLCRITSARVVSSRSRTNEDLRTIFIRANHATDLNDRLVAFVFNARNVDPIERALFVSVIEGAVGDDSNCLQRVSCLS